MSAFNLDLNVIESQLVHNENDEVARLVQLVAMIVGPQQALPVGTVTSLFDRDRLENLRNDIDKILESLPKKSDIVTANNLNQVNKMAENLNNLTGK